jgi:manganese-transporting P-type ATPase
VAPYPIQCLRDGKWATIQMDKLLPGDVVSIGESRPRRFDVLLTHSLRTPVSQQTETTIPADILLISGTCIVNEAMLSGESTPLLKESIQLLEGKENSDVDGLHKGAVLFSGTKVLQAGSGSGSGIEAPIQMQDVLGWFCVRAQGQLVRTMIFSTERVSANNLESFLFIGFLLIFAIAASWYVWVMGERFLLDLSKS